MSDIGTLIDGMAMIDVEIGKLQAQIKEHGKKRMLLESKLMRAFEKQKIGKASGRRANAVISSRRHPSIKDMAKFNKYVLLNKAFDLYQRRINAKAYFDRLNEGDAVPGVEVYEHQFIKITAKRG
jgi:hypothetical protein